MGIKSAYNILVAEPFGGKPLTEIQEADACTTLIFILGKHK
jgi:hypothetical protein